MDLGRHPDRRAALRHARGDDLRDRRSASLRAEDSTWKSSNERTRASTEAVQTLTGRRPARPPGRRGLNWLGLRRLGGRLRARSTRFGLVPELAPGRRYRLIRGPLSGAVSRGGVVRWSGRWPVGVVSSRECRCPSVALVSSFGKWLRRAGLSCRPLAGHLTSEEDDRHTPGGPHDPAWQV